MNVHIFTKHSIFEIFLTFSPICFHQILLICFYRINIFFTNSNSFFHQFIERKYSQVFLLSHKNDYWIGNFDLIHVILQYIESTSVLKTDVFKQMSYWYTDTPIDTVKSIGGSWHYSTILKSYIMCFLTRFEFKLAIFICFEYMWYSN